MILAFGKTIIIFFIFSIIFFGNEIFSKNVTSGEFIHIYDPSLQEKEKWYINDHTFIRNINDSTWHIFGITHEEPADPEHEHIFAHAISKGEKIIEYPYVKKKPVLYVKDPESVLWAPHVIYVKEIEKYYMFYCGGDKNRETFRIQLAISSDLDNWERYGENPLFQDGIDGRDPMVLQLEDKNCATDPDKLPKGGNHVVAYRTSKDLLNWSEKKIAYRDESIGTYGGNTESPFVVKRNDYYYLFTGPRDGRETPYVGTDVFKSQSPYFWDYSMKIGHIKSHAAEVIFDENNNKFFVSHCGWSQGGVYVAELFWDE